MALDEQAVGLRRLRDEHDIVAEVAQALDQLGGGALACDLVEVALAEVAERLACGSVPANDPLPMRCKSLIDNLEMQIGRGHNRRRL